MLQLNCVRIFLSVVLVWSSLVPICAQTAQEKKESTIPSTVPANNDNLAKKVESKSATAMSKADRLFYLRSFVDRTQTFEEKTTCVAIMADIASVTWKYDSSF